ncbi:uncharacterized protein B0P05DRAFT_544239, partial [Gilbertella persicaria]|uniref:uncharacterized protein n=1 Tax=Gilbertella persicaria TaxID=101096 RepID=UPI00221F10D8
MFVNPSTNNPYRSTMYPSRQCIVRFPLSVLCLSGVDVRGSWPTTDTLVLRDSISDISLPSTSQLLTEIKSERRFLSIRT